MPSIVKRVAFQTKERIEKASQGTKNAASNAALKRINQLKEKVKQASTKENIKKAVTPPRITEKQYNRAIPKTMSDLSRKAARQKPLPYNPNNSTMDSLEAVMFGHSEQANTPTLFNLEMLTFGNSAKATDGTLNRIEQETLGIKTPPQPKKKQQGKTITIHVNEQGKVVRPQPKRKNKDWQDDLNNAFGI